MITARRILEAIERHEVIGSNGYVRDDDGGLDHVILDITVDLEAVARDLNEPERPAKTERDTHIRIDNTAATWCGGTGGTVSTMHALEAIAGRREDIKGHVARLPEPLCQKCLAVMKVEPTLRAVLAGKWKP